MGPRAHWFTRFGPLVGLVLVGGIALGEPAASTLHLRFGVTHHPTATAGTNGRRARASAEALPAKPKIGWRRRLGSRLISEPIVDAAQNIYLTTTDHELLQLNSEGEPQWHVRLAARPSISPWLLAGGRVGLLTMDHQLRLFSSTGEALATEPSDGLNALAAIQALPLFDGSFVLAADKELRWLASDLSIRGKASLKHRALELYSYNNGALILTRKGDVLHWARAGSAPEPLGRLPRQSVGAYHPFLLQNELIGALGARYTLKKGLKHDAPTAPPRGARLAGGKSHALVLVSRDGPFPWPSVAPRTISSEGSRLARSPLFLHLNDELGTTLLASANRPLQAHGPDGAVKVLSEAQCREPVSLLNAGPRRAILACASGTLFGLVEE